MRMQRVAITDGLREIGKGAFSGCTRLSEMELPATLVSLEESAIDVRLPESGAGNTDDPDPCKTLVIRCHAATPPAGVIMPYDYPTYYSDMTSMVLEVPAGCAKAYSETDWGRWFPTIKEMEKN